MTAFFYANCLYILFLFHIFHAIFLFGFAEPFNVAVFVVFPIKNVEMIWHVVDKTYVYDGYTQFASSLDFGF